ncbi:MAG: sensor histidine kinase [Burkholderiaceae bacterium]|nr:sensor histidine kinase [Burkholderiaceae bacterium]
MQKPPILSTSPPPAAAFGRRPLAHPLADRRLVFDACHAGVVLRALLCVETALGVGVLYGADSPAEWGARLALITGGAVPATLVWLITACSLKRLLQRCSTTGQYLAGVTLGALAGLLACALLNLVGFATMPPWLASAASGALLAGLLVAALVLRARGRTPAAVAARLAELQSRIRPHFLFNTLNSAIALVRAEPAQAEALLEDLSDLFRHALQEQGESVTLAEEVDLARRYLGIEQVRFGERLRVRWDLDPRAHGARLPPLLLQPLVENAVKHGVEASAQGGALHIQTQWQAGRVQVRITNTLPPPPVGPAAARPAQGHGMALANVRARLALLHDVASEFHAGPQRGLYEVHIALPCPHPLPGPDHAHPDR